MKAWRMILSQPQTFLRLHKSSSSSLLFFFQYTQVHAFHLNVSSCLRRDPSQNQFAAHRPSCMCKRRAGNFRRPGKMKKSNHLKTHKTQVSVVGPSEETHLALHGCYSQWVQLRVCVCVHACLRACAECVLTLVMSTVFGPSWEICSKLDFKQTWVCLMRCWSEVQVWSHKGKGKKKKRKPVKHFLPRHYRHMECRWAVQVPSRCREMRAITSPNATLHPIGSLERLGPDVPTCHCRVSHLTSLWWRRHAHPQSSSCGFHANGSTRTLAILQVLDESPMFADYSTLWWTAVHHISLQRVSNVHQHRVFCSFTDWYQSIYGNVILCSENA